MKNNDLNIVLLPGYDPEHCFHNVSIDRITLVASTATVNILSAPTEYDNCTVLFKLYGGRHENNNEKILNANCLYDIPAEWLSIINSGKCQIVVDTTVESWSPSYGRPVIQGEEEINLHEIYTAMANNIGINPTQITWITSDMHAEDYYKNYNGVNVKSHCIFYFMSQSVLSDVIQKDMNITDNESFNQFSLCLMRDTAKTHRLYTIYKLYQDSIDTRKIKTTSAKILYGRTVCDNYVSFYDHCQSNNFNPPVDWKDMRSHILEYYSQFPHEVENDDIAEALRKTVMSVVSESYATGNKLFITYSTFRAILARRPFIFIANKGILLQLKKWGFKTYNHLFDESYDNIEDVYERTALVIDTVKKISESDWQDIYSKSLEVAEYNYNHFISNAYKEQDKYVKIFSRDV